ncbi:hypothetical protein MCBMB27_02089 [Methylobacterium phyllosphaerae]|uniref:Uncharacterized protein n=1 Tax=Methylobacterium phyllosphaerae TaxID=418223 RepID=A0AAE8HQ38_9HYPH|nr:hypothetical protein MCBMB27_02089 [Methylobacterium phyllosphaerae]SFG64272.1 hypothetical protein SAMN05192567_10638 [Methylobacterium phyllosphaerae]
MDRLSSIGRFDLQHAAEARRDRWLIPLLVVLGMLAGAALFAAGMATAYMMPPRCQASACALTH